MSFLDGTKLEQLSTSISSHHIESDINTLFHLHASSQQYASKSNGITLRLITASVVLTLFVVYYFAQTHIWNLVKKCVVNRANKVNEDVQKPQSDIPTPSRQPPVVQFVKTFRRQIRKQDSLLFQCKLFEFWFK